MRSAGLPIEVLIEYVSLFKKGDETIDTRKNILIEQRQILSEKIEEMKNTLSRLDKKIAMYDDGLIKTERCLKNSNEKQYEYVYILTIVEVVRYKLTAYFYLRKNYKVE